MPTIPAIQRTNLLLVAVTAAGVLSLMGALILAAAGAGVSGTMAKFGVLAIPLKMLIVVGLVYMLFTRSHIDGFGFALGILTQMAAAIIETGRASLRSPG